MARFERARRRSAAVRNPSVLAHDLRWSMSTGRPVRVTDATGKVTTAEVLSLLRDPDREARMLGLKGEDTRQMSTLIATLNTRPPKELAVDSITKVQKPLGDVGRAFGEG